MHCDGSQEGVFVKLLEQFRSYLFTSMGDLIFDLKFDSGSAGLCRKLSGADMLRYTFGLNISTIG